MEKKAQIAFQEQTWNCFGKDECRLEENCENYIGTQVQGGAWRHQIYLAQVQDRDHEG
jgi:hypothetical protein